MPAADARMIRKDDLRDRRFHAGRHDAQRIERREREEAEQEDRRSGPRIARLRRRALHQAMPVTGGQQERHACSDDGVVTPGVRAFGWHPRLRHVRMAPPRKTIQQRIAASPAGWEDHHGDGADVFTPMTVKARSRSNRVWQHRRGRHRRRRAAHAGGAAGEEAKIPAEAKRTRRQGAEHDGAGHRRARSPPAARRHQLAGRASTGRRATPTRSRARPRILPGFSTLRVDSGCAPCRWPASRSAAAPTPGRNEASP